LDYSKLSYSVQKKTDKVYELKIEKAKWSRFWKIATGVNALLLAYILVNNNRYTSYATNAFENQNLASGIRTLDLIILIIFAVAVLIVYWAVGEYREVKEAYEKIRKDLIKTINNEFCTCNGTCVCKDEYIKDMEARGIDLIYL
jgi:hypothetical protein